MIHSKAKRDGFKEKSLSLQENGQKHKMLFTPSSWLQKGFKKVNDHVENVYSIYKS